jgi:hypothetical protein
MGLRLRSAMSHLVMAALLIALTIVGMSGCGSSSSSGSSTTPVIASGSFKAAASTITDGNSTTLSWSVSNATTVSIDHGIGIVTGNSVTVSPTVTTTYTLTATNAAGTSATAQTKVTVVAAPTIANFAAKPLLLNPVTLGTTTATLSWSAADATTISIDNGIGTETVGVRNKLAVLAGVEYPGANLDGPGTAALFDGPIGIAVDASSNLYVADAGNNVIRKIVVASDGTATVSTIIGAYDNPTASVGLLPASIFQPYTVAVDSTGNLYIAVPNAVLTLEP